MNEGRKNDEGKVRLDLIDPNFIEAMGRILTHGAKNYGDYNWRGLDRHRIEASLLRHTNAWRKGEVKDTSSPYDYNLAAVAVNAMFLFYFDIQDELNNGDNKWHTNQSISNDQTSSASVSDTVNTIKL